MRNPYAPMERLSPDQMQDLHDTSIRILKDPGVKVLGNNVRTLFARAGAKIDDDGVVRIDESNVDEALKTVQRHFSLTPRNPAKRVVIGDGQPVTITPFTLMGAMTPVSLPAALAQQNAEGLFGVVLTKFVKPGAPVMYGAFTSNVHMRSGAPAFGAPENTKANVIAGQLARRYGLPYRTSNANASNAVDLQAAYETSMATWGAVMGGANLIYHAAGWLEGGLTASFEKLILDVEILQNMVEFCGRSSGMPTNWDLMPFGMWRRAGISSVRRIPWRAMKKPSTSRCFRTGGAMKTGNWPARKRPGSVRPGFGSRPWPSTKNRQWIRLFVRNWKPMSPSGGK